MDRKKIIVISAGDFGIGAHIAKTALKENISISVIDHREINMLKNLFDSLEYSEVSETVKAADLISEAIKNGRYEITPELQKFSEILANSIGAPFNEVLDQILQLKNQFSEPRKINDFKDIAIVAEKLDNYRPGFYPDAKIEQYQDKNPGAKIGGRKHKKNPFRKGGNKW